MRINHATPQGEGILTVQLSSTERNIPYSIDFVMTNGSTINVSFWLVQAVRQAVPMLDDSYDSSENKIMFIKALRLTFNFGLKEAKDIAEWFLDNVDRSVCGKF